MRARIARAMMFVAAASLFFALVCPLAVTPMPVGKVKRISDAMAPASVPAPAALTAEAHPPEVANLSQNSQEAPPADIPGLICVRTC